MKLEHGSFVATSNSETVILNDSTITPDRVIFWVEGARPSHGYDNGTMQVAAYGTGTATSSTDSIHVRNGSTVVMAGKISAFYTGEFDVTFTSRTADIINFLAIED